MVPLVWERGLSSQPCHIYSWTTSSCLTLWWQKMLSFPFPFMSSPSLACILILWMSYNRNTRRPSAWVPLPKRLPDFYVKSRLAGQPTFQVRTHGVRTHYSPCITSPSKMASDSFPSGSIWSGGSPPQTPPPCAKLLHTSPLVQAGEKC